MFGATRNTSVRALAWKRHLRANGIMIKALKAHQLNIVKSDRRLTRSEWSRYREPVVQMFPTVCVQV
jgi:hypothetical protein